MLRSQAKVSFTFCMMAGFIFAQLAFGQSISHNSGNSYNIPITVESYLSDYVFENQDSYDVVTLENGVYFSQPGEPMIPSRVIKVALPEGMIASDVVITESTMMEIDGKYTIYPSQPPIRTGSKDTNFTEPDKKVYSSTNSYPLKLVELIRQTDLAGQGIAVIRINQLQYIPAEKSLNLYNSISFTIEGTDGYICGDYLSQNISETGRQSYESMVRDMVINPEAVQLSTSNDMPLQTGVDPGDYDYVIITPSSYASYFQPLADWKTKKGVPATVVTREWIYGEYAGDDTTKIRAFIVDAYNTWGATYFLLGGDSNNIPFFTKTLDGDVIPNDTYYGDYDSDWTTELHVGRASVRSTTAINQFNNKIFTYEKNPPLTNYAKKVALFGFDLDASTYCENCKNYINNNYIPAGMTVTTVYDSHGGNHETYVKSAINAGQNLINHCDHTDYWYMGVGVSNHNYYLTLTEIGNFSNGSKQSIMYSLGCWSNAFDYEPCVGEQFARDSNGGCIGYIGNTRYGWYHSGTYNTLSMLYDRYFFWSLYSLNYNHMGDCFTTHKNYGPTYSTHEKYVYTELTLLGDPELPIWTEDPMGLVVDHPALLTPGSSAFTVHVEDDGGANVILAYVCLWKGDEVYLTGHTDGVGNVTLYPSPMTPGTMYVTVTKHNYLPHESEAEITEYLGAIDGVVRTQEWELIGDVHVTSVSPDLEDSTNENGEFVLYGFESGVYSVSFSHPSYFDTTITGITVTENDTTTLDVILTPIPNDVGISAIFNPPDSIMQGVSSAITVEATNFGTDTQSFDIVFEARVSGSSSVEFADTASISNLPGNTIDTVTFSETFTPAIDTVYELISYTTLSTDMNNSNDSANKIITTFTGLAVWYGNIDRSPITAFIASRVDIDVYMLTSDNVYIGDVHMCLGVDDVYITDLISQTYGQVYYPLSEWDFTEFTPSYGSPPNPTGWSSQSFLGWCRLVAIDDAPWLHTEVPTKIITFAAEVVDEPLLIGQTIDCIGEGLNQYQGPSNAGDSSGDFSHIVVEYFSPLSFFDPFSFCDYIPGDINGDENVIGSDVTFGVRYFQGIGSNPPDSCWNNTASSWLYSAADANGDCNFIGSDITFMINYFRGGNSPQYCPDTPPLGGKLLISRDGDISIPFDGSR